MKPIETRYAGCRFRSRLEARWAVFFDTLELIWEYEKEGFEFKNGERYLPDFWFPELDCFFEVKGPALNEVDKRKAYLLSREAKKLVVTANSTMNVRKISVEQQDYGEWSAKGFCINLFAGNAWDIWPAKSFDFSLWDWSFEVDLPPFINEKFPDEQLPTSSIENLRKRMVELDRDYYQKKYSKEHPRYQWGRHIKNVSWRTFTKSRYGFALEPDNTKTERISRAYEAARSARFEFGESG